MFHCVIEAANESTIFSENSGLIDNQMGLHLQH
jgi:hypothetical protein